METMGLRLRQRGKGEEGEAMRYDDNDANRASYSTVAVSASKG